MQLRAAACYSPARFICSTKANAVVMSELNRTHFIANAVQEPFWDIVLPLSMITQACVLLLSMFFLALVKLAM